ncbi:hypothetical protein [Marinobacter changyiensis]|uniref:hypothetical protein n=1 Tax=Marinobacter changyiensis TaxID=2604091 RepID=UPI0012643940|nr:hypothetical protein [Marinobacter changyiensis]
MSLSTTLPPAPPALKWSALLSIVLFLALMAANQVLITAQAPQGLISFQLAATALQSLSIISSWGNSGQTWAVSVLWLDFILIATYVVALLMLVNYLMSDRPGVREQKLGRAIKALFLATGVSDLSENVLLLNNFSPPTDNISLAASVFALIKFTGLVVGTAGLVILRAARRRPLQH